MSDRQSLTGSFADSFGRKKRIENSISHLFRDASACIGDANLGVIAAIPRADGDRAGRFAAVSDHVRYGMGSVDDEVQYDLIEFTWKAGDQRKIWIEVSF